MNQNSAILNRFDNYSDDFNDLVEEGKISVNFEKTPNNELLINTDRFGAEQYCRLMCFPIKDEYPIGDTDGGHQAIKWAQVKKGILQGLKNLEQLSLEAVKSLLRASSDHVLKIKTRDLFESSIFPKKLAKQRELISVIIDQIPGLFHLFDSTDSTKFVTPRSILKRTDSAGSSSVCICNSYILVCIFLQNSFKKHILPELDPQRGTISNVEVDGSLNFGRNDNLSIFEITSCKAIKSTFKSPFIDSSCNLIESKFLRRVQNFENERNTFMLTLCSPSRVLKISAIEPICLSAFAKPLLVKILHIFNKLETFNDSLRDGAIEGVTDVGNGGISGITNFYHENLKPPQFLRSDATLNDDYDDGYVNFQIEEPFHDENSQESYLEVQIDEVQEHQNSDYEHQDEEQDVSDYEPFEDIIVADIETAQLELMFHDESEYDSFSSDDGGNSEELEIAIKDALDRESHRDDKTLDESTGNSEKTMEQKEVINENFYLSDKTTDSGFLIHCDNIIHSTSPYDGLWWIRSLRGNINKRSFNLHEINDLRIFFKLAHNNITQSFADKLLKENKISYQTDSQYTSLRIGKGKGLWAFCDKELRSFLKDHTPNTIDKALHIHGSSRLREESETKSKITKELGLSKKGHEALEKFLMEDLVDFKVRQIKQVDIYNRFAERGMSILLDQTFGYNVCFRVGICKNCDFGTTYTSTYQDLERKKWTCEVCHSKANDLPIQENLSETNWILYHSLQTHLASLFMNKKTCARLNRTYSEIMENNDNNNSIIKEDLDVENVRSEVENGNIRLDTENPHKLHNCPYIQKLKSMDIGCPDKTFDILAVNEDGTRDKYFQIHTVNLVILTDGIKVIKYRELYPFVIEFPDLEDLCKREVTTFTPMALPISNLGGKKEKFTSKSLTKLLYDEIKVLSTRGCYVYNSITEEVILIRVNPIAIAGDLPAVSRFVESKGHIGQSPCPCCLLQRTVTRNVSK